MSAIDKHLSEIAQLMADKVLSPEPGAEPALAEINAVMKTLMDYRKMVASSDPARMEGAAFDAYRKSVEEVGAAGGTGSAGAGRARGRARRNGVAPAADAALA